MYPFIKVISDVHEEFFREKGAGNKALVQLPKEDTDKNTILVIAGDWNTFASKTKYSMGIERLKVLSDQYMYVLLVLGNHDYWGYRIGDAEEWIKDQLKDEPTIFLLERDTLELEGMRFVGTTMWANMCKDPTRAWELNRTWSDLKKIRTPDYRKIRATEIAAIHVRSYKYIESVVSTKFDGPTIVVTHHVPCELSVIERYKTDWRTHHCYVSDQSKILEENDIALWFHGHLHNSSDYEVFGTRIVCNPKGYVTEPNPDFNPDLLIDLNEEEGENHAKFSEDSKP